MMTEKANKTTLTITLGIISLVLLFGGEICHIISDHWPNVLHESDWYHLAVFVGWIFVLFAAYFRPVTNKQDMDNAGWNFFLIIIAMGFLCILQVFKIQHFTAPIVAVLIITSILAILGCILNYRKWLGIKAQLEKQENEKNPE